MRSFLKFSLFFCFLYSCSEVEDNQNSRTNAIGNSENRTATPKGPEGPSGDCCDLVFISETVSSINSNGCCVKQVKFTNNSNCSMKIIGPNYSFILGAQSVSIRQVLACPGQVTYFDITKADNNVLCRSYPVYSCGKNTNTCPNGGITLQWSKPLHDDAYCTNVQVNIDSLTRNNKNCRIKKIEFTYNKIVGNIRTSVFNTHVYQLGVTPDLNAINQSQYPDDNRVPNNVTTNFLGDGDCFVLENLALPGEIYTLEVCYTITLDCTECPPITGCKTFTIACE